ncbi:MAG: hypothetical protein M1151_07685 [Candidatus Thermoplasmatota archaeon]|nr:hypothetical protein [Candidatus Thermoplasmatota archaeon]
MGITVRRERRGNGKEYYKVYDVRRVNRKIVQKYVGYLGKSPGSKREIDPETLLLHVERLLKKEMSQEDISAVLKRMGIEYDAWPITKIIIENDLRLEKVFLKLK